ncbi:MAG: hypothetical protein VW268_02830 [Rhodospirillaceae bacterium]
MSLKDILVEADNDGDAIQRIHAAGRLAEAHGAHMTALFAEPNLDLIPMYAEATHSPEVLDAQYRAAKEAARRAKGNLRNGAGGIFDA